MGESRAKRRLCVAIASALALRQCFGLAAEGAEGLVRGGEFGACRRRGSMLDLFPRAQTKTNTKTNKRTKQTNNHVAIVCYLQNGNKKQSHWDIEVCVHVHIRRRDRRATVGTAARRLLRCAFQRGAPLSMLTRHLGCPRDPHPLGI